MPLIQLFPKAAPKAPICYHSYINHLRFAADKSLNPDQPLQVKLFCHLLRFTTARSSQRAGSEGNAPSEVPSPAPRHPALRSASLSARFARTTTEICQEMALCLTLNSDPQQKKCRLVILQCMCYMILSIPCISPNLFTLARKFTDKVVLAEDHISDLRFCMPSAPCYDRDL